VKTVGDERSGEFVCSLPILTGWKEEIISGPLKSLAALPSGKEQQMIVALCQPAFSTYGHEKANQSFAQALEVSVGNRMAVKTWNCEVAQLFE
jgi:hypothetical protein